MENKSDNNSQCNVIQELVRFSVVVSISKDTENWTNTPCDQFPHRLQSDSRSTLPCKAVSSSPQPWPGPHWGWSSLVLALSPERSTMPGSEAVPVPQLPCRWWDGLWFQALPCCCRELPLLLDPHGISIPDISIIRPKSPSEKDPHCSYTCTWSFPLPLTLSASSASTSLLHYDPFNIAIPHQ